jgi:tRNA-splicing endonuclease subunit Sen2
MSLITPTNRRGQRRGRGGGKGGGGGARNAQNNKLYAHPLPLIFEPAPPPTKYTSLLLGLLGLSGGSPRVLNPHCTGYFDLATRSVWITDPKDAMVLWRRGFFGKGDLSRSEPSWLPRQISARRAGKSGGT